MYMYNLFYKNTYACKYIYIIYKYIYIHIICVPCYISIFVVGFHPEAFPLPPAPPHPVPLPEPPASPRAWCLQRLGRQRSRCLGLGRGEAGEILPPPHPK